MTDYVINIFPPAIYILFVLGFYLLIKGADWLVEGGASIARRFNISELVIGLTIISFGTSMPELVVNLLASVNDSPGIAIGNIIGSNISNILLILGVTATISPLLVKSTTVWKEVPLSILAVLVLAILANDSYFLPGTPSLLTRGDGLILLAFFVIFIYYTFGLARLKDEDELKVEEGAAITVNKAVLMVLLGLFCLFLGGDWIVRGGVKIARDLGVSEMLIALTMIALGTSLPELAASIIAVLKNKCDMAIGNVVGSNIFNIFWILGVSATVKPIPFSADVNRDIMVTFLASFLLFFFFHIGKKNNLGRIEGIIFIVCYLAYIIQLVFFGNSELPGAN